MNHIKGILAIIIIVSACTTPKKEVSEIIKNSGKNRHELSKVIEHYKNVGDKQKLKAAYFLIRNMKNKYGLYYTSDSYFLQLLPQVDSLKQIDASTDKIDNYIQEQWKQNGHINNEEPLAILDVHIITADYLINNIDLAFQAWEDKSWASHLDFDKFCELVLPYRVNNEPLQNWRGHMMNQLDWVEDSLKDGGSVKDACMLVNGYIANDFQFSHKLNFVPMLGGIDSWNNRQGLCEHRYQLIVMALRSIGIPCTIDFTQQYVDRVGGHSWPVLYDTDCLFKSFNGGEPWAKLHNDLACPIDEKKIIQVTSIFRKTFSKSNELIKRDKSKDIPENLRNSYFNEVNREYVGNDNTDITLQIKKSDKKTAYLYCFSYGENMIPISSAEVKRSNVTFKSIGRGGCYLKGYYSEKDGIDIDGYPFFIFPKSDSIKYFIPDVSTTRKVIFTRKFPVKYTMYAFMKGMIGARLQGANKNDFSDSITLYTISDSIDFYKEISLKVDKPYKYYRYISSDTSDIRIADISLFQMDSGIKHKINGKVFGFNADTESDDVVIFENAFDDNIRTNLNAPVGSWVAIDLGSKKRISSFSIIARNNMNIIEPGDEYALFYFDKEWEYIEKKIASKYLIEFENVPSNALLLLKNFSKGREERIFIYEDGKQIWL